MATQKETANLIHGITSLGLAAVAAAGCTVGVITNDESVIAASCLPATGAVAKQHKK